MPKRRREPGSVWVIHCSEDRGDLGALGVFSTELGAMRSVVERYLETADWLNFCTTEQRKEVLALSKVLRFNWLAGNNSRKMSTEERNKYFSWANKQYYTDKDWRKYNEGRWDIKMRPQEAKEFLDANMDVDPYMWGCWLNGVPPYIPNGELEAVYEAIQRLMEHTTYYRIEELTIDSDKRFKKKSTSPPVSARQVAAIRAAEKRKEREASALKRQLDDKILRRAPTSFRHCLLKTTPLPKVLVNLIDQYEAPWNLERAKTLLDPDKNDQQDESDQ